MPIAAWAKKLFDTIGLENAIRDDPRNNKTALQRVDNLRDLVGTIIAGWDGWRGNWDRGR